MSGPDSMDLGDVDIPEDIGELDLNQLHEFSRGLLAEIDVKVSEASSV